MSDPAGGLQPFLELDARRRASFGKIGRPEHRLYLVDVELDGTIILRPAVVVAASSVSDQEARLLARPDLAARIEANRKDPSRLVKRPRRKEVSA